MKQMRWELKDVVDIVSTKFLKKTCTEICRNSPSLEKVQCQWPLRNFGYTWFSLSYIFINYYQ